MSTTAPPGPITVEQRAMRDDMRGIRETRVSVSSKFELREIPNGTGGTNLRFTGFACVTGAEYEMEDWIGPWTESVSVGAFKKTLSEGADVAFLLNHEGMTLARTKPGTLKLSEQSDPTTSPIMGITGLHSEALLDPQNMYVQAMRSAVDRGDLDEMSFAFRVMRQEWNEDYTRRWLNELNLDKGDTSLVNYGANPNTGGTVSLRQRLPGRGASAEPDRLVQALKRSKLLSELRDGHPITNSLELRVALGDLFACDDSDTRGLVVAFRAVDSALAATPPEPSAPEPTEDRGVYRAADWPDGAKCADCERVFVEGDEIEVRGDGDAATPVCRSCPQPDPEPEPEERGAQVIFLPEPDPTIEARARLAAMRR